MDIFESSSTGTLCMKASAKNRVRTASHGFKVSIVINSSHDLRALTMYFFDLL